MCANKQKKGDQNGHPLGIVTDYLPTEFKSVFVNYFKQLMVEAAGVEPEAPLMDKGFQAFPGKKWEKTMNLKLHLQALLRLNLNIADL